MEYSLDGSSEESDDESIWSLDSDEAYEADNIYYDEQEYYDDVRNDNTYHLGLCKNYGQSIKHPYVLLNVVNVRSFLKYNIDNIMMFLTGYSLVYVNNPTIDIIHVHHFKEEDHSITYDCVIKTHYLRLIQRCWKRQMITRNIINKKRMRINNIMFWRRTGKWPAGLNVMPGLYGMFYSNR
jgi:hypothetical protein